MVAGIGAISTTSPSGGTGGRCPGERRRLDSHRGRGLFPVPGTPGRGCGAGPAAPPVPGGRGEGRSPAAGTMFDNLSRTFQGLFGRLSGKGRLTESNVEEALREVRVALLEADVSLPVARDFIAGVKAKALGEAVLRGVNPGQMMVKIISDALVDLLGPEDPAIAFAPEGPTVILMAGLQGAGKTTTCGKLAYHLRRKGRRPLLVAADVQRPAAVEQLRVLGSQIEVPVHSEEGGRPPRICQRAVERARTEAFDTVILDTAGRLHVDEALMAEVAEIAEKTRPHEIFLVCDAMTGQDAVISARKFHERLPLTGVILTKLDGDARGGAALSVKAVVGRPIKFVGLGEKIDRLDVFHPRRMADRILGMGDVVSLVEKAQETIDQAEAEEQAEKLFVGSFSLGDFMTALQRLRKMGPIGELMKLVPGMGAQMGDMAVDEKDFVRMEAAIQSMTPDERLHPEILNMERRERIARGAGIPVHHVHELLKGFRNMKKQLRTLRKMGILGSLFDPTRKLEKTRKQELDALRKSGVNPFDTKALRSFRKAAAEQRGRRGRG